MQICHFIRKSLSLLAFSVVILLTAAGAAHSGVVDEDTMPAQRLELPNGLIVVVHEDHRNPIAAVVTHISSGYRNEDPGEAGISHLMEHMILRGTVEHPGFDDIPARVRELGGMLNGATGLDHSETFMVVPSDRVEEALGLAREIYTEPLFDVEALGRVKSIIRGEIEQKLEDPVSYARDLLLQKVLSSGGDAPGDEAMIESIESIGVQQLKRFHEDHYRPANTVLSVAGDVDAQRIFDRVRALFGEIPRGEMRRHGGPDLVEPQALRFARHLDRYASNVVLVGFPLPPAAKGDLAALRLVGAIVVDGQASRLRLPLMVQHYWVHRMDTTVAPFDGMGLFELSIVADDKFEDQALREFFVQLDHIRRYGVRPMELENARAFLATRRRHLQQDVLATARRQARIDRLEKKDILSQEAAEAQVTQADLQRVIERWLGIPRATVVELLDGPSMNARPFYARIGAKEMQGHLEGAVLAGAEKSGLPPAPSPPPSWYSRLELAGWARVMEETTVGEGGVERFEYPNGAVLLVREVPGAATAQMQVWFRGGRITELPNSSGGTALMQSLMVRHTFTRRPDDMARELDALGSELKILRTLDAFGFSMETLPADAPYAFDVLYDIVANPQFESSDLAWKIKLQIQRLHQGTGNLHRLSGELLRAAAWGDHPYGLPDQGIEKVLRGFNPSRMADMHTELCNPRNAVIVVTGAVNAELFHEFLDLYMKQWTDISDLYPAGAEAFFRSDLIDPLPPVEDGSVKEVYRSSPVAAVQVGVAAGGTRDPDRLEQDLLEAWLNASGGPLQEAMMAEDSVYRVAVGHQGGVLGGLLCAYAACPADDLPAVEKRLVNALGEAAVQPPSEERLTSVVRRWSTGFFLERQSGEELARFLAEREIAGLPPQTLHEHVQQMEACSAEGLATVARRILRDEPHAIGRVNGGHENKDGGHENKDGEQ